MWSENSERAVLAIIKRLNTLISEAVGRHGGIVVKTIGDATMAVFKSRGHAARALGAAKEIQALTVSIGGKRILQRVGMASGYFYETPTKTQSVLTLDYYGRVVNLASRMESELCPGDGESVAGVGSRKPASARLVSYRDHCPATPHRSGRILPSGECRPLETLLGASARDVDAWILSMTKK
jgi:hypothetical protein